MYQDFIIWSIDVEFTMIKSVNCIPFVLTVRDAKIDWTIVSVVIDYEFVPLVGSEVQINAHKRDFLTSSGTFKYQLCSYFQ